MPEIDQELLSLENELRNMITATAELRSQAQGVVNARGDLESTRESLESLVTNFEALIHRENELIRVLRESAPDKIITEMSKISTTAKELKDEVENLDDEFIGVKDALFERFNKSAESINNCNDNAKKEIIDCIKKLHERYVLMADKVSVANDKIVNTQDRILDAMKKQEENMNLNKSETQKLINNSSKKIVVLVVIVWVLSFGLGIVNFIY